VLAKIELVTDTYILAYSHITILYLTFLIYKIIERVVKSPGCLHYSF